jgi:anti-sigma regulatory factor (Ser/Thr protein kinase)
VPTVELRFTPLPAHVRTARLVAASVGRRSGVDESLVDEIKLAVGEACARAVAIHQAQSSAADVVVRLIDDEGSYAITVRDCGTRSVDLPDLDELRVDPAAEVPADLPADFGLAVVTGLVDDSDVSSDADGTTVSMRWPIGPPAVLTQ